jgi:hypothetical protein
MHQSTLSRAAFQTYCSSEFLCGIRQNVKTHQNVFDVLHEFGPDSASLIVRMHIAIKQIFHVHSDITSWAHETTAERAMAAIVASEPVLLVPVALFFQMLSSHLAFRTGNRCFYSMIRFTATNSAGISGRIWLGASFNRRLGSTKLCLRYEAETWSDDGSSRLRSDFSWLLA